MLIATVPYAAVGGRAPTEPRAINVSSPLINEVIIPIGQKDKYNA